MKKRLIGAFVALVVLILVVFGVPLASFVAEVERERLVTALERDAFILAGHAKETLSTAVAIELPSLVPYVEQYSQMENAPRVVVTNADGLAVATNDPSVVLGNNFSNRPEISSALIGDPSVGERSSQTLGEPLVFVAVPVLTGDEVLGVVRFSQPKSVIDDKVQDRIFGILLSGGFTLLAAIGIAFPMAIWLARPITRLTQRTERLADGDFLVRANENSGPPEVRELAKSFNGMASRLGLLIDSQRQFAGAVSHQLRTPLTALQLRLEQAQEMGQNADERILDSVEASRTEADRLQEMIEQLLTLSRLEGQLQSIVTIDAALIGRARAEIWESLADEKSVKIKITLPRVLLCRALEGALEQIIDNFIDNALTVAPEHSIIEIYGFKRDGEAVIDVLDQGPGLTIEQQEKAFERFWRGPLTENTPGTGLGLAIVRQLAVASGGSAMLLPNDSGGVCARVVLEAG